MPDPLSTFTDTEKELFDELVSELIDLGYLSEPRYAEMLIRSIAPSRCTSCENITINKIIINNFMLSLVLTFDPVFSANSLIAPILIAIGALVNVIIAPSSTALRLALTVSPQVDEALFLNWSCATDVSRKWLSTAAPNVAHGSFFSSAV